MPALKGIDDSPPGIRLFRIGTEEERQCVVLRAARGRPQRQRRRAKYTGAA
jgi:hypothetical protein